MVVRFVCVIRVPVCPECVPAPPRCLFTGLQSTGRNNRATRRGVRLHGRALATRAAAAARVDKWRTVSIHSSASAV